MSPTKRKIEEAADNTPAAKKAKLDAASGAGSESQTVQATLLIAPTQPFRPKEPSLEEIVSGR